MDYTEKIERFVRIFPRENVKIVFFKDFKINTDKVYMEILEFAGVKSDYDTDLRVVNKARKQRFPRFVKAVEKIMKNHDASNLLDLKVMRFISSIFFKVSLKERERRKPSPTALNKMKRYTKRDVIKFNEFLHKYGFVEKNFDLLDYWDY